MIGLLGASESSPNRRPLPDGYVVRRSTTFGYEEYIVGVHIDAHGFPLNPDDQQPDEQDTK